MDHLVKLLKNHGMTLEVKPITHNKKSYFVGVEMLQSEDKFTVSLGVSGFLSRLRKRYWENLRTAGILKHFRSL